MADDTSAPRHPGGPVGGPPGTDDAAVAAYLAAAPPAVRDWLRAQAGPATAGVAPPPGATPAPNAHLADTVDDGLDDGLGDEDDDVIGARLHARAAARTTGRTSRAARVALVTAVLLGVSFGIWFAGRTGETPADATSPALTAGNPDDATDTAAYVAGLRSAVEADPSDVDARLELGAALFNDADLPGAKEQWDAVLEIDPEQSIAWYNLGFYHMSSDPPDWDAVRDSWQRVLELDPTSSMAVTIQTHMDGLMSETGGTAESPATAPASPGT